MHTHQRCYQDSSPITMNPPLPCGAKKGRTPFLPEANCFKRSLCHSSGLLNLSSLEVESHVLQPEDGAIGTAQHQAVKIIC